MILLTLFLLTFVHGIQIVALYNYNHSAGVILTDSINDYVERGYWVPSNISLQEANPAILYQSIRVLIGSSETDVIGCLDKYGFCLSDAGFQDAVFNVTIGLFFIYLFIFSDVWKVMFGTVVTRSFPSDPHFSLMLFGAFWLILLNATILTWLGVQSGFSVIASSGDFYAVLFNSLNIFIILKIDETVLPLIRFFVEDFGHLNAQGDMSDERLALLVHGTQYHKPGYGQHWIKNITTGPIALRIVAVLNAFVALGIVGVPLAITIYYTTVTFKRC